ncbi:ribonuclease Z [Desulfuromonas versatilis]|nr:MBL fold metallo-hydrolase [Desulfuromonas versatilis]
MNLRLPFRFIEPTFYSGLLDDPILYLRVRPLGRALLVDCGQIHHLAKRVLKSLDAVFVSHGHMDHFMGIETLTRNMHVAPRTVELFGPPGIAEKLAHKLQGYDWNLTEEFWGVYRVHEVAEERLVTSVLRGPEGFPLRREAVRERSDRVVYRNRFLRVEAELCDHKIPVMILRITERDAFQVDPEKLAALDLVAGGWLRELNRRFYREGLASGPLRVSRRREGRVVEETLADPAALYRQIRGEQPAASIGYVTDVGFSEENRRKIVSLLRGVTLLIGECAYLAEEMERARRSCHLCTSDVNRLLEELRPGWFLPMHLSKNHRGCSERLYAELQMPPGTTLLRIPEHIPARPLIPREVPRPEAKR